ncbi:MAG TPA: YggS family pyridoxal phosphate enzyme [Solirubrobacteraceae bacterium]|nr:YggS family pyridoxal phosphate enzyme [Solirubrobacteraceae bacterium]
MARLIERPLDLARVRENVARVREQIDAAHARAVADGNALRDGGVELLAAIKYLPADQLPTLAEAGIRLVGENRAQELQAKHAAHGELFEWDFIGQLQSRRVKEVAPCARLIHSVASESALAALERCLPDAREGLRILIEVNIAGEEGKAGVAPGSVGEYVERSPVPVAGLMTMPPLAADPEQSRPWFARLRELAREHGLEHLSIGTSQDYVVAVEEGASIVRIGTKLYD